MLPSPCAEGLGVGVVCGGPLSPGFPIERRECVAVPDRNEWQTPIACRHISVSLHDPHPQPLPTRGRGSRPNSWCRRWTTRTETSLLQLALAAGVLAVLPDHPLAVLGDELGDQRHGVLAVVVEGDGTDDGVVVHHLAQGLGHLLAIGPDPLDRVEDQLHRHEGEGAIGFRRLLVAGLVVLLLEEFSARQLLDRRALDEAQRAFRQRSQPLDVGVRLDAGRAFEHRGQAELVHLRTDADADRREAAEIDDLGSERLGLGELGGEILLVGGDAIGADDLPAVRLDVFGEVLVVALAVVGGVVNDHPLLEALAQP